MTPPMTPPAMTASSRVFHQVEISKSTSSLRRRTLPSAPENDGCDAMEVARAFSSYIHIYIYSRVKQTNHGKESAIGEESSYSFQQLMTTGFQKRESMVDGMPGRTTQSEKL